MKKEMLINVLQPEEIRIAIIEDGLLEELYVERTSHESYVGNIYKGRIVNIEPSIQAAFVDFGVGRNGFLHVSDVEPTYYRHLEQGRDRDDRDRGDRRGGPRRGGRRPGPEVDETPLPNIASLDDDEVSAVDLAEEMADVVQRMGPVDELCDTTCADDLALLPDLAPLDEDAGYEEAETGGDPAKEELPAPQSESIGDPAPIVPSLPSETVSAETEIVEEEDEAAPAADSAAAGDEEKETDGRGRGRRRGRGRGRTRARGKRAGAEEGTAPESDSPPATEPGPAPDATPAPPSPPDRPFPMSSAEHRTDDGKLSAAAISDEDLSFSMASPTRESRVEREPEVPVTAPPPPPPAPPPPVEAREPEPAAPMPQTLDFPTDEMPPLRSATPSPETTEEVVGYREPELPELAEDHQQFQSLDDRDIESETEELEAPPPRRGDDRRGDDRRGGRGGRDNRDNRGGPRGGPGRSGGRPGQGRPGFNRSGSSGGRAGFGRPKPLIQDIFKRGQEVLVQVIKEGIGTKGPTLSTYISIAGRYLVLMPGLNRIGVSRKIEDEEARRRLRDVLYDLQPPKGLGFIIRTAGLDRNRKELQRDLAYLSRLWQVVVRRIRKIKSPAEIYQESDMITRTIRDIFTQEIDTIWVDEKNAFEHAQEFLQVVMPRYAARIKHYDGSEPMFHKYGIESEMDRIQRRHVPLPAGGSIVIDQTEALVAIDVNSGNFRADNNAEETAYQMNLQAAKEIARQLRLRDLGGVIVNDFIDMRDEKHRRGVERALREAVQRDRARTKILRISQFGIIEMTRQRIRPSLKRSVYHDCPHCHGTGQIKTVESMSIEVMRLLQLAAHREPLHRIEARVHEEVAFYLLNRKRAEIARLEETGGKQFFIQGRAGVSPEFMELSCFDNNNNEVKFLPYEEPVRSPWRRS